MYGYGNTMFLATHGILARSASGGGVDPDAQAFITAASITDPTQQSAINQLVVDLKGYSIWTKMKALYPFCGSTSSQHKWNLKDPRDLDVAFRILWSGGVTHSSNGVQFGGINGYGNTKLIPSTNLTLNSNHISVYSRTNVAEGKIDFGVQDDSVAGRLIYLSARNGSSNFITSITSLDPNRVIVSNTDGRGFYLGSRSSSTSLKGYKNGTLQGTNTTTAIGSQAGSFIALGALNYPLTSQVINYSSRELAFASIGDGLTDTEATNFYTAVQAFQVTLGRSIGTQTVSDADAQAFVTNAGIVDQVEANAINNLVIGLKADGLWSKIYAAYPMVGGTSTSTSYNLKNTAQYQITWNGGWTWNNNGVTPNGTNGFGNTGFNPVTAGITKTNFGVSAYSRTNIVQVGSLIGLMDSTGLSRVEIRPRSNSTTDVLSLYDDSFGASNYLTNSLGLFTASRSGTTQKYYQGATEKSQRTGFAATADINGNIYLGARNWVTQAPDSYSTKQTAWVAFHEFFDATQQTNYSNRIQTFQTALARQV